MNKPSFSEFSTIRLSEKVGGKLFGQESTNEVSLDQIKTLLNNQSGNDSGSINTIQDTPEDIAELEEFCRRYGIIGVGFPRKTAKENLKLIKNIIGYRE